MRGLFLLLLQSLLWFPITYSAPRVAPLQEGVPSSRTARKEIYVEMRSLFSGLIWWVEGTDHSGSC